MKTLVALVGMKLRGNPRRVRPNRELETAALFFTGTAALFFVLAFIVSAAYVYLGGTSPAPRWIFNLFDGFKIVSVVDGVIGLFLFTLAGLRTVRRWIAGDAPVPPAIVALLRLLLAREVMKADVEAAIAGREQVRDTLLDTARSPAH
jgi:hypothetical protein